MLHGQLQAVWAPDWCCFSLLLDLCESAASAYEAWCVFLWKSPARIPQWESVRRSVNAGRATQGGVTAEEIET